LIDGAERISDFPRLAPAPAGRPARLGSVGRVFV
jgi:hypothetical protein